MFPEFANTSEQKFTTRIDTKLLKAIQTEEGESKDEAIAARREILDTIGKPGKKGEQVRCVVSVSMLTEGWDAQNVTHIFGVRAFDSQLLCEQVVGRGLRRMSYTPESDGGKLPAEHVDVYGIPFSLIPFKGSSTKTTTTDPIYHEIFSVPERSNFRLSMPNVESYTYILQDPGIICDVESLPKLEVVEEPTTVYLAPTRGYDEDGTSRKDIGDFIEQTREAYYKSVRPQQIYFKIAQLVTDDLLTGAEGSKVPKSSVSRHTLFPRVLSLLQEYVAKRVKFRAGVDERELGLEKYATLLRERLRTGIQAVSAKDKATLLPIPNSFRPETSTADVNYRTSRRVLELTRSHLNCAAWHTDPERRAIRFLDTIHCVECFTPNDPHIGLLIHYEYQERRYTYEPDFIVRLKSGLNVILEIKGVKGVIHAPDQVNAKNAAAQRWVSAVNNAEKWGKWAFVFCEEDNLHLLRQNIEALMGGPSQSQFKFLEPTDKTAWKTCVPLTTLAAAAGGFGAEQLLVKDYAQWSEEWVTWDGAPKFEEGMFVAQVYGTSMLPMIPDGAYCLFRKPRAGTRQGKVVLVCHAEIQDPHTGGRYTVKVYESEKRATEDGSWEHVKITLKPKNPAFEPIILTPDDEDSVRVVAEFAQALKDLLPDAI